MWDISMAQSLGSQLTFSEWVPGKQNVLKYVEQAHTWGPDLLTTVSNTEESGFQTTWLLISSVTFNDLYG